MTEFAARAFGKARCEFADLVPATCGGGSVSGR